MELKPGYKQTEVGVIPEDWDVQLLQDLSTKIMVGIASAATHAYRNSGVPMFRNQNIKEGWLDKSDLRFLDPAFDEAFRGKRLCGGDLLTARTGYPGTTAVVPPEYTGAQSFTSLIIRPDTSKISSSFLCLYINSPAGKEFFEQSQIGGAQKNVNANTLKRMPVAFPRRTEEQEVIASAAAEIDALTSSLEALISKKQAIKQAAMQELLTGKRRLPGFEGEWEVRELGSLGIWRGGMTPSMQNPDYWNQGDFPWISSGDVKVSRLSDTSQHVTADAVSSGAAVVVPANSIVLVTRSGILRKQLPVSLLERPMAINQDIKALIPARDVDSSYLLHALTWAGFQILKSCMKTGTTVESVEFAWLKRFTIPMPIYEEQVAIAKALSEMENELTEMEARRVKASALKQGMMQQLLTGKIRLT